MLEVLAWRGEGHSNQITQDPFYTAPESVLVVLDIRRSIMRRYTFIVFFFLLLQSGTISASDDVAGTMKSYLVDFNKGYSAKELVGNYFNPTAMFLTPTEILNFSSHQDAEKWMEAMLADISRAGWVRSEYGETSTCKLSQNVAIFSFRLKRVFQDGAETISGGTYTLFKSDRWRIASAIFVEPGELVNCDDADV